MKESTTGPASAASTAVRAALVGGALAFVIIGVASRFDVRKMTFGDGVLYRYVAENLAAPPAQIAHDLGGHGTALRYGRIVLPAMTWTLSAGNSHGMEYVQPLLMIVAAAAIAAGTRLLFTSSGPLISLTPFVAPGLTTSLAGGFAEPVAVAFVIWAVVLTRKGWWLGAAPLLSLAILTRENAAAALVGLAVWCLLKGKPRGAAILATSLVPVGAWYLIVRARFGFLPQNDPFLRHTVNAFGPPFIAAWRSLTQSGGLATLIVAIHLVIAIWALYLWRSSDLGAIAGASALQLMWNGPPQWHYVGDGVRLQVFLEVSFVLVVLERVISGRRESGLRLMGARPG